MVDPLVDLCRSLGLTARRSLTRPEVDVFSRYDTCVFDALISPLRLRPPPEQLHKAGGSVNINMACGMAGVCRTLSVFWFGYDGQPKSYVSK